MYLKLALRNAKRSIYDYLLYLSSMVLLTSIVCFSNCMAEWGNMQAGFQTMALPLLLVFIMAALSNYINHFIIGQRAREFATYMLLGMEKETLLRVFLCELSVIGLLCFLLGAALGMGIFSIYCRALLQSAGNQFIPRILWNSISRTFLYFGCVEILSLLLMRRKINRLQIVQLIKEKQRNQPFETGKKPLWGWLLIISFFSYLTLLSGIAFLSDSIMSFSISFISLPMLLCVFSFYKWLYAFTASLRLSRSNALYQGNRLYQIAAMTRGSKTGAKMNAVFCSCFLFSAVSFVFGTLLLNPKISVFERTTQQWMGFLQISICLIFMILYFSILSLLQLIDLKAERRHMRLLFHMGKSQADLKYLLCTQTLLKLFLPILMAFILLLTAVPFVNYKLNSLLPIQNHLLHAACCFMVCFFVLYAGYFGVVYAMSKRYILMP